MGHFLFIYSDTFAVGCIVWPHWTAPQSKSYSYCLAVQLAKNWSLSDVWKCCLYVVTVSQRHRRMDTTDRQTVDSMMPKADDLLKTKFCVILCNVMHVNVFRARVSRPTNVVLCCMFWSASLWCLPWSSWSSSCSTAELTEWSKRKNLMVLSTIESLQMNMRYLHAIRGFCSIAILCYLHLVKKKFDRIVWSACLTCAMFSDL